MDVERESSGTTKKVGQERELKETGDGQENMVSGAEGNIIAKADNLASPQKNTTALQDDIAALMEAQEQEISNIREDIAELDKRVGATEVKITLIERILAWLRLIS